MTMINNYIFRSILLLTTSLIYHHLSSPFVNAFQVDDCLALCSNELCESACRHKSDGKFSSFSDLVANTSYRFRLSRLIRHGVSRSEVSDWFSTYDISYVPKKVSNVSLLKIEIDKTDVCRLSADIRFEPADDLSCDYNILYWQYEHDLRHFVIRKDPTFRFHLKNLEFDRNTTIYISSVNGGDQKFSDQTTLTFVTPSCLETHNNLRICPPQKVEGLRVIDIYKHDGLYDVTVNWDKPSKEPDNYTIQLETFRENKILLTIPGNATEAHFLNIKLEQQYQVSIIADSVGGSSPISWKINDCSVPIVNEYSLYQKIMISLAILMTVLILMIICMYLCKRREKLCCIQYTNFRVLNQKEFPTNTLKLLQEDKNVSKDEKVTLPLDKFELSPKKLKLRNILGIGAYGIVRLGTLQDDFGIVINVAVKGLKDNPTVDDINNFYQEIQIMKSAGKHPNIVSLIGYCTIYNKPLLIVEYCCNGDLQTYLRKIWKNTMNGVFDHKSQFTFEQCFHNYENDQGNRIVENRLYDIQQEYVTAIDLLNFARQIANGMEFLSTNRIVHRDLAARNILVCSDNIVKISDFGLSRDIYQENVYKKEGSGKLPLKWMAIEALTHQIYTTHSDVWSFGILLWEIVTLGCTPYPDVPTNNILKLLKTGYRMEKPSNCGENLYNIMYSCWHLRPQSRPTFTELKKNLDTLLNNWTDNKYLNLS
ncbi:tyrosine-protein kinase receptor torso isoform X2 [Vespa crabro]|uniref:tyrosine-protein kinase receptor torso isoform X2 n=1 Tax=Vespa crabro TaxID=7445 RepID=UPI001F017B63|nr:tyrosine-protein kinase receptor torso isoform X2 [Vespa crabro]